MTEQCLFLHYLLSLLFFFFTYCLTISLSNIVVRVSVVLKILPSWQATIFSIAFRVLTFGSNKTVLLPSIIHLKCFKHPLQEFLVLEQISSLAMKASSILWFHYHQRTCCNPHSCSILKVLLFLIGTLTAGGPFLIHLQAVHVLALVCAHAPDSGPQIHWSMPLYFLPEAKNQKGWLGWKTCDTAETCGNSEYAAVSVEGKALAEVEDSLLLAFEQCPWTPFCSSCYEANRLEEKGGWGTVQPSCWTHMSWVAFEGPG